MNCIRCTNPLGKIYYEAEPFCMLCAAPNNITICSKCINKATQIMCGSCEEDMFNIPAVIKYLEVPDEEEIT